MTERDGPPHPRQVSDDSDAVLRLLLERIGEDPRNGILVLAHAMGRIMGSCRVEGYAPEMYWKTVTADACKQVFLAGFNAEILKVRS